MSLGLNGDAMVLVMVALGKLSLLQLADASGEPVLVIGRGHKQAMV